MAEQNDGEAVEGGMTDSGLFDCMETEEGHPDQNQVASSGDDVELPNNGSQELTNPPQSSDKEDLDNGSKDGVVQENVYLETGGNDESPNPQDTDADRDNAKEEGRSEQDGQKIDGSELDNESTDNAKSRDCSDDNGNQADEKTGETGREMKERNEAAESGMMNERMPADGEEFQEEDIATETQNLVSEAMDAAEKNCDEIDAVFAANNGNVQQDELGNDNISAEEPTESLTQNTETETTEVQKDLKTANEQQASKGHDLQTQNETDFADQRTLSEKSESLSRKDSQSAKSVKFADETPQEEKRNETEDEDRQVAKFERYEFEGREGSGDETGEEEEEEEEDQGETPVSPTMGLFQTAVSEEKIEEAKHRKASVIDKEAFAVDLFGRSEVEKETMEEVIENKAQEHYEKGLQGMRDGDFYKAVISFDKALNLKPREIEFFLKRGECYLQICDFQSAILNYKKACVLDPDCDEYYTRLAFIYFFQGQTLFDQHKFSDALESFSRAAEMKPEIVGYHTRSVACLAALQRHGECLALVNKRLEVEHENPDLYIMRARLHSLFRNTTLCYYDLKDALQLNPEQEEAKQMMAELEEKANEYKSQAVQMNLASKNKESLQKISMAIDTNPTVADYHVIRGALHRRLLDFNSAIDDYLLALDKTDHDEDHPTYQDAQRQLLLTYNDFAVECFSKGFFDEAIILLNKAIKGEKREKGLYVNRGDCFFKQNELQFALADYHQALELDQDWSIQARIANIHNEFGLLDYEDRSFQEAEARFTIAIQHNPRVAQYYVSRSKVRFMMENHGGARQDLLMALHLDPTNDDLMSLLPRLFPGKGVGDVMKSKASRAAKLAVENAVVMASPVKLPTLDPLDEDGSEGELSENKGDEITLKPLPPGTAFSYKTTYTPGFPDLKACMNEMEFHKHIVKGKKKITTKVKKMLHDRDSLYNIRPKIAPLPPARPVAIRGGAMGSKGMVSVVNPGEKSKKQGWRTYSLGISPTN
ncbi:uncharacterized protein LOC144441122 [Glandiceps talaboti]